MILAFFWKSVGHRHIGSSMDSQFYSPVYLGIFKCPKFPRKSVVSFPFQAFDFPLYASNTIYCLRWCRLLPDLHCFLKEGTHFLKLPALLLWSQGSASSPWETWPADMSFLGKDPGRVRCSPHSSWWTRRWCPRSRARWRRARGCCKGGSHWTSAAGSTPHWLQRDHREGSAQCLTHAFLMRKWAQNQRSVKAEQTEVQVFSPWKVRRPLITELLKSFSGTS